MAVLGNNVKTLTDITKEMDPMGKAAKIVEILAQTNHTIDDMTYMEGNLPTGHRTTIRTGLPDVYWRMVNQGTPESKATTAQVDEPCGILSARSELDCDLAELNGDVGMTRINEARAFLEAMAQEAAQTVWYGNVLSNSEEFNGLTPRYNTLSSSAEVTQNVIDGGGVGTDNSSIWLVVWGMNSVTGIYPKGSMVGLTHEDLGKGDAFDSNQNRFRAYLDDYKWKMGLSVRDWRYAVRICNIDISNLPNGPDASSNASTDLIEEMIKATHRIPNMNMGKACFYMNRTVFEYLDIQRREDVLTGGQLKYEVVDGKLMYSFRGIPVRIDDQLLLNEPRVTS